MSDYARWMKGFRAAIAGCYEPTEYASEAALAGYQAGQKALAKGKKGAEKWGRKAQWKAAEERGER